MTVEFKTLITLEEKDIHKNNKYRLSEINERLNKLISMDHCFVIKRYIKGTDIIEYDWEDWYADEDKNRVDRLETLLDINMKIVDVWYEGHCAIFLEDEQ